MLEATPECTVTTTGFDIGCHACWMPRLHVPAGRLEPVVTGHRLPVLLAVHVLHHGLPQTWMCAKPRPLTR